MRILTPSRVDGSTGMVHPGKASGAGYAGVERYLLPIPLDHPRVDAWQRTRPVSHGFA